MRDRQEIPLGDHPPPPVNGDSEKATVLEALLSFPLPSFPGGEELPLHCRSHPIRTSCLSASFRDRTCPVHYGNSGPSLAARFRQVEGMIRFIPAGHWIKQGSCPHTSSQELPESDRSVLKDLEYVLKTQNAKWTNIVLFLRVRSPGLGRGKMTIVQSSSSRPLVQIPVEAIISSGHGFFFTKYAAC